MNMIPPVEYPERDGKALSDNSKQLRWIVVLFDNLTALFSVLSDVFVAGDLLWYPVERQSDIRQAPDVMVVFGRPKGDRGSYRQWQEDNIPVQVVFEILSPGNSHAEMVEKQSFYEDYGVEEYYIYDPDKNHLIIYRRQGDVFRRIRPVAGFVSPRLGIRFDLSGPEMVVYGPDGQRFLSFEELKADRERVQQQADRAQQQADRAQQQADRAQQQTDRAQQQADRAQQQADRAEQRADRAEQRVARLAELSRKARRQQASPEELQELDRLEDEASSST